VTTRSVGLVVGLLPQAVVYLPFAVVLLLIGRTRPLGVLAAGLVVVAFLAALAPSLYLHLASDYDPRAVGILFTTLSVVRALLLVGAWGVARRRGAWWLAGLPVTVVVVLAEGFVFSFVVTRFVSDLYEHDLFWVYSAASTAVYVGSLVVSGLICWGLELLGSRSGSAGPLPAATP